MIDKSLYALPGFRRLMNFLMGLFFVQSLFVLAQAWFLTASLVLLWQGRGTSWNVLGFLLAFAGRHGLTLLRDRKLDVYAYNQSASLRQELLKKIFRLGPSLISTEGTGSTVTTVFEGVSQMEEYIRLVVVKMIGLMLVPLLLLVAIFLMDPLSGGVLLLVFPIVILFFIILGLAAQRRADRQYENYQLLSNHFMDSMRGLETLKLFGLSREYAGSIYSVSERFRKSTLRTLQVAFSSTFAMDFFTTLSIAIVAVFLGLRLLSGEILLFPALFVLILAPEYFLPLRDYANDYHATLDGRNAMRAINQLLETKEPENQDLLELNTWDEKSRIRIESLAFSYKETLQVEKPVRQKRKRQRSENIAEEEVLTESEIDPVKFDRETAQFLMDFEWTGYGKIGIVGTSGTGKSTFIQLLAGFLQADAGEIQINDQKIPHFSQKSWQTNLSLIPQSTYLFSGTLRDNIRFYQPSAGDDQVQEAVRAAGLENLGFSLDTVIGAGAREVSGGQAQRIALARAFLSSERKILLLDEPTAHLDIETELEIKEAILPLLEKKLVFFSTHRLHWMPQMDFILVVHEGRIVAKGTHENLLATNVEYQVLIGQMRGEKPQEGGFKHEG